MIQQNEKTQIQNYLNRVIINEMEFYEELYDHIATSYENRATENQSVKEHIATVVEPDFGGIDGIRKIKNVHARQRRRMITRKALTLFTGYFLRWPAVLITCLLILLLYIAQNVWDSYQVFEIVTILGMVTPCIISQYGRWKFKQNCKKYHKPYSFSQVNNQVYLLSISFIAILQGLLAIISRIFSDGSYSFLSFFQQYPMLYIPMGTLLLIYGMVCLQLFKENFKVKLLPV